MSDWAAHYATAAGFRFWPSEALVAFVAGRRFGTVVEAGCGGGGNLWFLAEHADRVMGVDLSEEALLVADDYLTRRGVRAGVELHCADVRHLPIKDARADLVVDCLTAQHLPWAEHGALFAEYRRVLRPGGQFWVMHLNAQTWSPRGRQLGACDFEGLALFPTVGFFCLPLAHTLAPLVHRAGFRVRERSLERGYPDGQIAAYTICEGEAQ